jgi:hypothetical protein
VDVTLPMKQFQKKAIDKGRLHSLKALQDETQIDIIDRIAFGRGYLPPIFHTDLAGVGLNRLLITCPCRVRDCKKLPTTPSIGTPAFSSLVCIFC